MKRPLSPTTAQEAAERLEAIELQRAVVERSIGVTDPAATPGSVVGIVKPVVLNRTRTYVYLAPGNPLFSPKTQTHTLSPTWFL